MLFDLSALQAIFSGPVHAAGERPGAGAGEAAYWLPLPALFTGARLEELAQLRPEDVYEERDRHPATDSEHSAWVIRITNEGEGQGVKNVGSVRRIAIHPELVRLKFIFYAKSQATQRRLFPLFKTTR